MPPTIYELSNEDPRSRHQNVSYPEKVDLPPTIIGTKSNKPARAPPPTKVGTPTSSSHDPEPPLDWSSPYAYLPASSSTT